MDIFVCQFLFTFCGMMKTSCKPFQRGRCDAFPDVVFLSRSDECSDDHRNCLLSARKKEVVLDVPFGSLFAGPPDDDLGLNLDFRQAGSAFDFQKPGAAVDLELGDPFGGQTQISGFLIGEGQRSGQKKNQGEQTFSRDPFLRQEGLKKFYISYFRHKNTTSRRG